ncbi:MAG: serine hydrolase domain-containing protein [Polyangiales bacterium]
MSLSRYRPAHIRVAPPEEVTTRNERAEVDPRDVGMTAREVESIWSSVVRMYRGGLHPAIALCVRHRGRVVIDRAIGHLRGNAPEDPPDAPKVLVRPDSLFSLFSASKAFTAMVVHLLHERGVLRLDDRIGEYIPEFAQNGKERATLRHVLTHRSGLPTVRDFPADLERIADWAHVIDVLCKAPALSEPGSQIAYHAISGGFILGEVVRRTTGKTVRTLLREEISDKLGLRDLDYGTERFDDLAQHAVTGMPPIPPLTYGVSRALGVDLFRAVELSNDPRYYQCLIPSGNVVCTADEASRFFQMLVNGGELDGVRVFDPETVRRAITPESGVSIDAYIGIPISYGMGFMLGNRGPSLFGWNAPNAFGHVGFSTVLAWADPDRALSACMMASGKPLVTPGQLRWMQSIYTIARTVPRVGLR